MIMVKCGYCGAVEQVPDSYAGKTMECECGRDVVVPAPCELNRHRIVLPVNNKLLWIVDIYQWFLAPLLVISGMGILVYEIMYGKPVDFYLVGCLFGLSFSCIVVGDVIDAFGSIELNTRANTELLVAALKMIGNAEK